jgi:hypothetical protein
MLKKLGIGAYIACPVVVLSIVSWILYGINVAGAGYFHNQGVPFVVLFSIFAILCELGAIAIALFAPKDGTIGKVCSFVETALLLGGIVFLMSCGMNIISARAQGLGYIFGADANAAAEFTMDDFNSAVLSIVSAVFYIVTCLIAIAVPFFGLTKKEETK